MEPYNEIVPDVWIMDNHKWALYCWEISCGNEPVALIHLDWHWDGINDFKSEGRVEKLRRAEQPTLKQLIDDYIIDRASFIAPALIRGIVDEVHFYCFQENTEPGLSSELHYDYGTFEIRHDSIGDIVEYFSNEKPFIIDLDLDLFNKSSPHFLEANPEKEIESFIDNMTSLIRQAEVITIAKSPTPWYINNPPMDWDKKLAEEISNIVIPNILDLRSLN